MGGQGIPCRPVNHLDQESQINQSINQPSKQHHNETPDNNNIVPDNSK